MPEMLTVEPTLPLEGLRVMADVTVNVVCAVAPEVSVAKIVCGPAALGGTVNIADQVPSAATVGAVGVVGTGVPANETFTVLVGT